MNKDQVKGRAQQAKGSIKETTGKVVGSKKLEAEGKLDKAAGKTQATYGDMKEDAKDAAKRHESMRRNPEDLDVYSDEDDIERDRP